MRRREGGWGDRSRLGTDWAPYSADSQRETENGRGGAEKLWERESVYFCVREGTHTILHNQLIPMAEDALLQWTQVQSAYLTITLSPPGVRRLRKRHLGK